jgi:hypothetical protein
MHDPPIHGTIHSGSLRTSQTTPPPETLIQPSVTAHPYQLAGFQP